MRIVDENTGSGFELRFRDNGEFPDVICINPNRPFSHLRKVGHISAHPDEVDNFFAPNDKFQHSPFALRQLASLVMAWQGNTEPL